MPEFKTLKDLFAYAEKQMAKGLEDVGREARELLQEYVLNTVYANNQSTYDRTYQFLRAITISNPSKVGDYWQISLYIDPDKITPIEMNVKEGVWNKHMSMDSSPFNEGLPFVLEYGAEGSPYYNSPAYGYMGMTVDEIKRSQMHIKALIGYMKTKGINISI